MAEGFLRARAGDRFEVASAGTATGTEAERLEVFRRVRDEILARLRRWLADQEVSAPQQPH
jgi:protein-tyrosine-phosphatase